MTSAQKIAKEKFKKAIAYRQKSGVSLKEAFAHVYGKKKVAKKVVNKKVAKKRIAGPKDSAAVKRELARKGLKMPHGYSTTKRKRKISGVKKKKISEQSILNKIHKVKHDVERLDEAQHKHMIGKIKAKPTIIALAKKIRKQTDMNEHNLAILSLAKFLKDKKSIELMNNVIKMHNNYNYMPKDLINIRDTIYAQLMITLKHKYGQVDYKEIEHSF
jgi:hypothetical protein